MMWWSPAVYMILLGILCDVELAHSQSRLIERQTTQSPDDADTLEADIEKVIDQIHSLSGAKPRSFSVPDTDESGGSSDTYYDTLSNLYGLFPPLARARFMDDLPRILVCILSGRQDCGLEAELTKTVSLELGQPLLTFLSSLRSQTCAPPSGDGGSDGFFGTYLRMGDLTTTLGGFQQAVINMLSSLSLSETSRATVSGIIDTAVTYALKFMATFLQAPMDYIRIALQFGIRVPFLDQTDTCEQGDLKQLIMWGMKHNVSWSLSASLVDILLDIFLPPEESLYSYPGPECRNPPGVLPSGLRRSASQNHTDVNYEVLCDRRNLATLNDTLCADVLAGSGAGSSASVFTLCQALSALGPDQMERAWSNMCYVIQALVSPLVGRSSADCGAVTPLSEPRAAPRRAAREASNLKLLACNFNGWLENGAVDAVLVSLCSDNERAEFERQVCSNALLMRKLLSDRANSWILGYCANSSADPAYLVGQFCLYEQWIDQPGFLVDSTLLEFCMTLDRPRITALICEHTGFLMLVISNPGNWQIMPNCTNMPPPPPIPDPNSLQLDSCLYSEWRDPMQLTTEVLSKCILFDQSGFNKHVCSNATFLNRLLVNKKIAWLDEHCRTSMNFQTPEPSQAFDIAGWCDYQTWGIRLVDDSVVGLCWQHDQVNFQKNVCCKASVFEKLLENPQNQWLTSVCTDIEEITMSPQVCRYSDWTRPIVVDMTELALCAELDALNFTSKVCANESVLQNLLVNQDNKWLIQHCANHSNPSVAPGGNGGGQEGGATGFKVADRCRYSSWSVNPPDAALLTQCWEHDQINFVSSVCPSAGLLFFLSREPSSMWVSKMCSTYTNYTTTSSTNASTGQDPNFCLERNLVQQFNWSCSGLYATACQPCATQNMVLQSIVRCWAENVRSRVEDLLTPPVATVLDHAVSTTVVVLLSLEGVQGSTWHITEIIRTSVLKSLVQFFKRENNANEKRVLLQCFGTILTNLLQTQREVSSDELLLIKEYFSLPLVILRPVLSAAHISTVRMILQYYNSNKNTLKVSDRYLSTMVSVLFQTHLPSDGKLFSDLAPLLAAASLVNIQALPSLQNNINVVETINRNLDRMSLVQRQAFGLWYSKVMTPSNITAGHQSLIRDTGNLITYLPFQIFQHLSAAQLLDGLDVLQRNTLTPLKQEFIARKLIGSYRNLTAQDFIRLGDILCLADPEDLLVYKNTAAFSVIRDAVMNCTHKGIVLPSHLVSNLLLNHTELQVPSALSPERLTALAPLLPSLGVNFLQGLTVQQLLAIFPDINSVSFSPTQAAIIVDKLFSSNMLDRDRLQDLGSLIVGVTTETLLTLTSDSLLSSLATLSQHNQNLCPPHRRGFSAPQANAIASKLWGFPEVVSWLGVVQPLLGCTPLLSVLPRTRLLVNQLSNTSTKSWNTQQAKVIFRDLLNTNPKLVKQDFLSLGTLGQGVSCKVLQERLRADPSPPSVTNILVLLRQQPALLHSSLKTCLINELYLFEFFPELLDDLGAEIALSLPVSTVKKFSQNMMETLRGVIVQEPLHFLLLSRAKQLLLVDKIAQKMVGVYTGPFTEEDFRSLGVMATFVADEIFVQVDRGFFTENMDFLRGLCYPSNKMEIVARILQEPSVFGPVQNWNQTTLSQVDRFLFFLPNERLQEISRALMTVGRVEKLFMSQKLWEAGVVGSHCLDDSERRAFFEKQQFVLQFFLGFLKLNPLSPTPMVPTCEILHTTAPSLWTSSSLTSMSPSAFSNCLDLMGRDPYFATYQRSEVLKRVKKMYGPVSTFSQSLISQLGGIATELTPEELSSLRFTERRSIAAMGAVSTWNNRQLAALFTTMLNTTKQSPSQLDSSTLVAMGYIVCGAKSTDMRSFNAVEFSKAALWLGQLRLSCSEEQLLALVELLSHSLAFGPMSSWGTSVFIEIGVLAAGLPDMAMSALVKEQIEGITPKAISIIPPDKFAVTFNQGQINMFSYEQGVAVTEEQQAALSAIQRTALAMVLTPWEDRPVNFRGRSTGLALSHSPLCLVLGLLMPLTVLLCPDS
ncbi:uncharacterized protein strc1 [Mugil cephalus]|uniref:uncharacterized protein strc1 n=1 Tax=Mugil cephalus TaxID=48193 RepID=UPI001FB689E6|nr:uncharacterized protein strc1 [Mugil cephalus]